MKPKLVVQRYTSDCVLACLAMATGKSYDDMFSPSFCAKVENNKGAFGETLDTAFELAGLVKDEDYKTVYAAGSMAAVRALLWKRRAIIQAPSLNFMKSEHAVYYTGDEIIDPSRLQVYRWLENMSPTYVWIFKD